MLGPRSRPLVLAAAVACLGSGGSATAVAADAGHSARARLSAQIPSVAIAGDRLVVKGRVRGAAPRGRIKLQQRARGRWGTRATVRGSRRFRLRWRAPDRRAVVPLRVVLQRGKRVLARSRVTRVGVTETEVLAEARVLAAPPPATGGTLEYSGALDVAPGEFVASGVTPKTPYGLLARVSAVGVQDGRTVAQVEPASLIEAIPAGRFDIDPPARAAQGPTGRASDTQAFAENLSCGAETAAAVKGSLRVSLDPQLSLEWGFLRVKSAEASVTLRGDADLAASINGEATCELTPTAVARWQAPPIRFTVGPVPVVIVPATALYVAAKAQASGEVAAGLHGYVSATAGLRAEDGEVRPIGDFDHGFDYTPPTTRVDASLAANVIPSVTFLMYGVAGPRFDLMTGLRLDAGIRRDPRWTLSTPVELRAMLEVPHFEQFNAGPVSVFSTSFTLAEADMTQEPPSGPLPDAEAGERARIRWNTNDTDVDLHVWDVATGEHAWYGSQSGISDGRLSSDITTGYGPEWFTEHSGATGRTLAYGLCYYNAGGAGATDVTVRLIDPGGQVRGGNYILHETGDTVMLGTSPGGGSFTPPDGWCRGG